MRKIVTDPFTRSVEFVLDWEKGFSADPEDRGGPTNFGITERTLTEWRLLKGLGTPAIRRDVEALTVEEAVKIYRVLYWERTRCGDLPPPLAFVVFGCAVLQGVKTAKVLLQRSLGVKDDGILGPVTMRTIEVCDLREVVLDFQARRGKRFGFAPSFVRHGRGWMRRLLDQYAEAVDLISEEEFGSDADGSERDKR